MSRQARQPPENWFTQTPNNQKAWPAKTNLFERLADEMKTIFYQNLWPKKWVNFENLQNQARTKPKKRTCANVTWPKDSLNNHKPQLTRTLTNSKNKNWKDRAKFTDAKNWKPEPKWTKKKNLPRPPLKKDFCQFNKLQLCRTCLSLLLH